MASRTKLTPFARLFLFLIIILPLAYGGASYLKGEDPIANIKEMIGGQQASSGSSSKTSGSTYNAQDEIDKLRKENKELRQKVKELQKQLDDQKSDSGSTRQKWGN